MNINHKLRDAILPLAKSLTNIYLSGGSRCVRLQFVAMKQLVIKMNDLLSDETQNKPESGFTSHITSITFLTNLLTV